MVYRPRLEYSATDLDDQQGLSELKKEEDDIMAKVQAARERAQRKVDIKCICLYHSRVLYSCKVSAVLSYISATFEGCTKGCDLGEHPMWVVLISFASE